MLKINVKRCAGTAVLALAMASILGSCGGDARSGPQFPGRLRVGPVELQAPPSRPLGQVRGAATPNVEEGLTAVEDPELHARLLVLAADGNEPALAAITQALDYQGTPYNVRIILQQQQPITAADLYRGSQAFYQGVILVTGDLPYFNGSEWVSALSDQEWQTLRTFEAMFNLRELVWYTYPTPQLGWDWPTARDTGVAPLQAHVTEHGAAVFPYLSREHAVIIQDAYTYLAPALDASVIPLLVDNQGHVLAGLRTNEAGIETLVVTFDSSQHLAHALQLSYGLINWVTRGLFVGARQIYMSPQVDDMFIADDVWPTGEYRNVPADLRAISSWQQRQRLHPTTPRMALSLAFNGEGTRLNGSDSLSNTAMWMQRNWFWINHTWSHENLDDVDHFTAWTEITRNTRRGMAMGFDFFSPRSLVTGDVSGLRNAAAMAAAYASGVRYVVTDTSRPGEDNPRPNLGIFNELQPGILMIPRRPNNLFYNVSNPAQWQGEYNQIHGAYWGRPLSYQENLDKESDVLVRYLLRGENDPWMFHIANLRAYEGGRTLLTDLLDCTLKKYRASFNLPIVTVQMHQLGKRIARQTVAAHANVQVTIKPGVSITLRSDRAVHVNITGLREGSWVDYGGQSVSTVAVPQGTAITLSVAQAASSSVAEEDDP